MRYNRYIMLLFAVLYIEAAYGKIYLNPGIYVRANMSSPNYDFIDFKNRFGGGAGITMETGWKWGYLEYGIGYSNVGMKYEAGMGVMESGNGIAFNEYHEHRYVAKGHYMEIPVAIAFRLANKKGFGMSVDGGGYMSVGVAGKIKIDEHLTCKSYGAVIYEEDNLKEVSLFGDKTHQYKRLDAGWKVGAKIHLGECVRIGVEYRRGLTNMSNLEGTKFTNNVFNLSLLIMTGPW